MKVEFEVEETRELFLAIADRLVEESGLSEEDRAALRRWRATDMRPGSPAMRDLTAKVNADIARTLENKRKSAVIKPDWR